MTCLANAIELRNITKRFGQVVANKSISLELHKGEILSLLGENGSGKTTLMNMLSGIYYPDEGQIFVDGKEVEIRSPKDAFDLHIGMIHQHFKLVDVFTAAENIILGLHGESMGAGLSLMALQYKPNVKFLVADCGYGRLQEVLCGKVEEVFHLPGVFAYPASFFCRILYGYSFIKVNPEEFLKENEIPVCFIHGEEDNFIPCSQSIRMHEVNKGYSELHTFPGADHAQSLDSDINRYETILNEFIAKVL